MSDYSLGDFIFHEIERRSISAREFARLLDVSHASINKFLDYGKKDVGYPSVDFILKLAKATETDVGEIMRLIDPTVPKKEIEYPSHVRVIADEMQTLSQRDLRLVEKFVLNLKQEELSGRG